MAARRRAARPRRRSSVKHACAAAYVRLFREGARARRVATSTSRALPVMIQPSRVVARRHARRAHVCLDLLSAMARWRLHTVVWPTKIMADREPPVHCNTSAEAGATVDISGLKSTKCDCEVLRVQLYVPDCPYATWFSQRTVHRAHAASGPRPVRRPRSTLSMRGRVLTRSSPPRVPRPRDHTWPPQYSCAATPDRYTSHATEPISQRREVTIAGLPARNGQWPRWACVPLSRTPSSEGLVTLDVVVICTGGSSRCCHGRRFLLGLSLFPLLLVFGSVGSRMHLGTRIR